MHEIKHISSFYDLKIKAKTWTVGNLFLHRKSGSLHLTQIWIKSVSCSLLAVALLSGLRIHLSLCLHFNQISVKVPSIFIYCRWNRFSIKQKSLEQTGCGESASTRACSEFWIKSLFIEMLAFCIMQQSKLCRCRAWEQRDYFMFILKWKTCFKASPSQMINSLAD